MVKETWDTDTGLWGMADFPEEWFGKKQEYYYGVWNKRMWFRGVIFSAVMTPVVYLLIYAIAVALDTMLDLVG